MSLAFGVFAIGVFVIAVLWAIGHPAIIDRGEGQPRPFYDQHSPGHFVGALAVVVILALVGASTGNAVAGSVLLWLLVEVAQRFPRDNKGGYFEWPDVVWDVLGALVGGLLVWLVRYYT